MPQIGLLTYLYKTSTLDFNMNSALEMERELACLLVETLALEEIQPEDIDPEKPLFGEGLGLDSIDALEIAMAISRKYGLKLSQNPDENKVVFYSLASLARYVSEKIAPQTKES